MPRRQLREALRENRNRRGRRARPRNRPANSRAERRVTPKPARQASAPKRPNAGTRKPIGQRTPAGPTGQALATQRAGVRALPRGSAERASARQDFAAARKATRPARRQERKNARADMISGGGPVSEGTLQPMPQGPLATDPLGGGGRPINPAVLQANPAVEAAVAPAQEPVQPQNIAGALGRSLQEIQAQPGFEQAVSPAQVPAPAPAPAPVPPIQSAVQPIQQPGQFQQVVQPAQLPPSPVGPDGRPIQPIFQNPYQQGVQPLPPVVPPGDTTAQLPPQMEALRRLNSGSRFAPQDAARFQQPPLY